MVSRFIHTLTADIAAVWKLNMTGIHCLHFYLLSIELGVSKYFIVHLLSVVDRHVIFYRGSKLSSKQRLAVSGGGKMGSSKQAHVTESQFLFFLA